MLTRVALLCLFMSSFVHAQRPAAAAPPATPAAGEGAAATRDQSADVLIKAIEVQKWYAQLADIAEVNEIRYTSAPPHKSQNPTAAGAKNPMIIHVMTFVPKNIDKTKKQPMIVFAHQ